jgi:DNA recombination protein RmuC
LANLRTIAYIWRQEQQNRNAQEIARQCAKLYDKFVGFVEDLEEIGKKLGQTQKSFDAAKSKLISGNGNLLRQFEQVKKLGVKPTKNLSVQLLDEDEAKQDAEPLQISK